MKKDILLFFTTLISFCAMAQYHFDFEDGNIDQWMQSRDNCWTVLSNNNREHVLVHNFDNPESGTDAISFPQNIDMTAKDCSWQFLIRHGYSPSPSNRWVVFISVNLPASYLAQESYAEGYAEGYAVGVNMTGNSDLLTFYRIKNGEFEDLIETDVNWQEDIETTQYTGIRIERNISGTWSLFICKDTTWNNVVKLGDVVDETYIVGHFFALYYQYTSSQDRKLWMDEIFIEGKISQDNTPPRITGCHTIDAKTIAIAFSEDMDVLNLTTDQFIINNTFAPSEIIVKDVQNILLQINTESETNNSITFKNIADLSDNRLNDTTIYFNFYKACLYDVSIIEVMVSPTPSNGLPEKEYIELYNKSDYDISLNNWSLCVNQKCKDLSLILPSKEFVIICKTDDTLLFSDYGITKGIDGFQTLPNGGAMIELLNDDRELIHYVQYSNDYYGSEMKKEGGWSLEMMDINNPCLQNENWKASQSPNGGSPGKTNSVVQSIVDVTAPWIKNISVENEYLITIHFSKNMDRDMLLNKNNYTVAGMDHPDSVYVDKTGFFSVNLSFAIPFSLHQIYTLEVMKEMADCSGNPIENRFAAFGLPVEADSNAIVINEILFDPDEWGTEFVEIYNRSVNPVNLNTLYLAIREDYTGTLKNITPISDIGFLLLPNSYFAITNNLKNLGREYTIKNKETVFEGDLPTLSDSESTIVLCDYNMNVIDLFHYSSSFHHPLLKNTDGISLERIDANLSTMKKDNWHSASSLCGYATPGYENSQTKEVAEKEAGINISPIIFSPDNDGFDDFLEISIDEGYTGYSAYIQIFNPRGKIIKNVANNVILGSQNTFIWNGTNDFDQLQPIGRYMITVKLVNFNGESMAYKKSCVLAWFLN